MKQIHKRFSSLQVREILGRYDEGKIERRFVEEMLEISKAQFFRLLSKYRQNKGGFDINYRRESINRSIGDECNEIIREGLEQDLSYIKNPDIPIWRYNYSEIGREIRRKYGTEISTQTIINRAKLWGYYKERKAKKVHDRMVISNNTGEIIQHDSSHHLFAPLSRKKWYLITSIDDYSRLLLEARFIESESSIEHIKSLERVFMHHGFPLSYYVDNHSIFRYVAGRDENLLHINRYIETDGIETQWQQVLIDCGVQKRNALSPQAKGKIERPYQWLQDHLVRRCARYNITSISEGQKMLNEEVKEYNYKRVHSTTGEVPYYRFKNALNQGYSLWRKFEIPKPLLSHKDIFCLRLQRRADGYRTISLKTMQLKVNGLNPYDNVDIKIYKLNNIISELRFWRNTELLDTQIVKNQFLKGIHF
jgi:hypothetical protein